MPKISSFFRLFNAQDQYSTSVKRGFIWAWCKPNTAFNWKHFITSYGRKLMANILSFIIMKYHMAVEEYTFYRLLPTMTVCFPKRPSRLGIWAQLKRILQNWEASWAPWQETTIRKSTWSARAASPAMTFAAVLWMRFHLRTATRYIQSFCLE